MESAATRGFVLVLLGFQISGTGKLCRLFSLSGEGFGSGTARFGRVFDAVAVAGRSFFEVLRGRELISQGLLSGDLGFLWGLDIASLIFFGFFPAELVACFDQSGAVIFGAFLFVRFTGRSALCAHVALVLSSFISSFLM